MEMLYELFMWMTVINLVVFIWSAVMCMLLKNLIVRIHGKLFGLSPEAIKATLYGFLGVYKIVFIVFVFVPWVALSIMT
jgi:hypothetical protein